MRRIESFCVNHDLLQEGIYISRVDGDVITYDLRMKIPNEPPFLENAAIHTLEHLFATYARNSEYSENIIYFGPMGCRTGFYFLTRGLTDKQVLDLTVCIMDNIAKYEGEIPGSTRIECGNYLDHDLEGAKKEAAEFVEKIREWKPENMIYRT